MLHQNNIVHRDLKPANVMLHNYTAKVGDFGFSKMTEDHDQMLVSSVGTPPYMSPQILAREKYTDKTDIWSLGIILYQMLFGRLPWDGAKDFDLLPKIRKLPLHFPDFPKVSAPTLELIRRMLRIEEADRISWEELFVFAQASSSSEPCIREKILEIVNGQSQSDVKIQHYARLYFDFNRVIKSTQHFEQNSNSNLEFVNHLLSVKSSKPSNNLEEEIRKESNHIKNRPLIEGVVSKVLSARNSAVMLVMLYYELTAAVEAHVIAQTGLVTALQTLLLKEASVALYALYKTFKGSGIPAGISEEDWQFFAQCDEMETLTTLSRYDSTIINLLFTTFLNSIKGTLEAMEPQLRSELLPFANQQFDQSGKIRELLDKSLWCFLDELAQEARKPECSGVLLKLGAFIIMWFENNRLKETALNDYYRLDLFKFYEELEKADPEYMRRKILQ